MGHASLRIMAGLACLAVATLAGCQSTVPTPSPSPGANRTVLFGQDFASGAGTFETYADDTTTAQASNGAFRITFEEADLITQSKANQSFGDAIVEVDATDVGPNAAFRLGIFCRMPEEGLFYEFVIDSAGQAATRIAAYGTTGSQPLTWAPSAAVTTGLGATNHLRADCVGPTFTFWINGQLFKSFSDTTSAQGDVGIFASSGVDGHTEVAFDNFVVSAP
jgi:hypothetical protein